MFKELCVGRAHEWNRFLRGAGSAVCARCANGAEVEDLMQHNQSPWALGADFFLRWAPLLHGQADKITIPKAAVIFAGK